MRFIVGQRMTLPVGPGFIQITISLSLRVLAVGSAGHVSDRLDKQHPIDETAISFTPSLEMDRVT
jgi:hypothetical protein